MVGAQNYIQVHKITALLDDETPDYPKIFEDIISHGYTPVLVEQGGTKIRDYIWPENPCIVLGNESSGFPARNCLTVGCRHDYSAWSATFLECQYRGWHRDGTSFLLTLINIGLTFNQHRIKINNL
jgi:hypothetical protein